MYTRVLATNASPTGLGLRALPSCLPARLYVHHLISCVTVLPCAPLTLLRVHYSVAVYFVVSLVCPSACDVVYSNVFVIGSQCL